MVQNFLVFCVLLLAYCVPSECRAGILNQVGAGGTEFVHQLNKATFNASIDSAPTKHSLVEFYASWCPACRKFKPTYERVGVLFNHPDSPYQGDIYVAAVDCKTETELCKRFHIERFPSIFWAENHVMATGDLLPKSTSAIKTVEMKSNRTAEAIVEWINSETGRLYSTAVESLLTADKGASQTQPEGSTEMAVAELHDIEEATAMAYDMAVKGIVLTEEKRLPLIHFVEMLSFHHPSIRCVEGSKRLIKSIDDTWKEGGPNLDVLLAEPICGPSLPRKFWKACDGEGRGYTCGLWMLFHSISVRLDDEEGAAWLAAIRGFVDHFFQCDICRTHFLEMSSKEKVSDVKTRKDVVMWLWRAHNQVNKRIGEEEMAAGTVSRKLQWPPASTCPACLSSKDPPVWNEDAVLTFLFKHYRFPRDSPGLDKAVHSDGSDQRDDLAGEANAELGNPAPRLGMSVKVLMIASFCFGFAACAWQSRHRRRRRSRRSIKS